MNDKKMSRLIGNPFLDEELFMEAYKQCVAKGVNMANPHYEKNRSNIRTGGLIARVPGWWHCVMINNVMRNKGEIYIPEPVSFFKEAEDLVVPIEPLTLEHIFHDISTVANPDFPIISLDYGQLHGLDFDYEKEFRVLSVPNQIKKFIETQYTRDDVNSLLLSYLIDRDLLLLSKKVYQIIGPILARTEDQNDSQ